MNLSITRIKAFKSCRRMYQLKYIEGLEPVQVSDALETGRLYHSYIDMYNKGEALPENDFSKERAMFEAYKKYIAYRFIVVESEKFLQYPLGNNDMLIGVADGIAKDGLLVEHKTTSLDISEYEYNLQWDEQILAYMLMTGYRQVWYTVCKKPTIRQGKNETDEQFYNRCLAWYDEDTDNKIRLMLVERTDEEVEEFKKELNLMLLEMDECNHFYRNTCHCNMWGRRCEYAPVCLNYDPNQQYIGFEKT